MTENQDTSKPMGIARWIKTNVFTSPYRLSAGRTKFNWIAWLFPAPYYAGYGKFKRALWFAVLSAFGAFVFVGAYAAWMADIEINKDGKKFSWAYSLMMVVILAFLILRITSPHHSNDRLAEQGAASSRDELKAAGDEHSHANDSEAACLADMVESAYIKSDSDEDTIADIVGIAYAIKHTVQKADDPSYCRYAKVASSGRYEPTPDDLSNLGKEKAEYIESMRTIAKSVMNGRAVDNTCNAIAFAGPNENIADKEYKGLVSVGRIGNHTFYATKEDYAASDCGKR